MDAGVLAPRFDEKVLSAQSTFRAVMDAMARPGRVQRVDGPGDAPPPMMPGTAALARALFDQDTLVWCDDAILAGDAAQWLRFHTSAPLTDHRASASFALVASMTALHAIDSFAFGTPEFPDRSTTLIVQAGTLAEGVAYELRGPGIKGVTIVHLDHRLHDLFATLAINEQTFPRGIDLVLVAGDAMLAIPRSTRIRAMKD